MCTTLGRKLQAAWRPGSFGCHGSAGHHTYAAHAAGGARRRRSSAHRRPPRHHNESMSTLLPPMRGCTGGPALHARCHWLAGPQRSRGRDRCQGHEGLRDSPWCEPRRSSATSCWREPSLQATVACGGLRGLEEAPRSCRIHCNRCNRVVTNDVSAKVRPRYRLDLLCFLSGRVWKASAILSGGSAHTWSHQTFVCF